MIFECFAVVSNLYKFQEIVKANGLKNIVKILIIDQLDISIKANR